MDLHYDWLKVIFFLSLYSYQLKVNKYKFDITCWKLNSYENLLLLIPTHLSQLAITGAGKHMASDSLLQNLVLVVLYGEI